MYRTTSYMPPPEPFPGPHLWAQPPPLVHPAPAMACRTLLVPLALLFGCEHVNAFTLGGAHQSRARAVAPRQAVPLAQESTAAPEAFIEFIVVAVFAAFIRFIVVAVFAGSIAFMAMG